MNFVRTDPGPGFSLNVKAVSRESLNNQKMAEPDRPDGGSAADVGNPPEVTLELSLKTNILQNASNPDSDYNTSFNRFLAKRRTA